MNLLKLTISFAMLVSVVSCALQKNSSDNIPSWVKSRPLSSGNYVGIGKSSKESTPNKYMQLAKNIALEDLSSEISVDVSSWSLLSIAETSNGFAEGYTSVIKTKTQKELKDYELISTYENKTDYWVYYELDRGLYFKQQEEKKNNAINSSLDFYLRSENYSRNNNLKQAIVLNIKAIYELKNYWADKVHATIAGESVLLGNELISNLSILLHDINIETEYEEKEIVRGKEEDDSEFVFSLKNSKGISQGNMPVVFSYSGGRIPQNRLSSNSVGEVSYTIQNLPKNSKAYRLSCTIALEELVYEANNDYMLAKLLENMSTPRKSIKFIVKKPNVFISSEEYILGKNYYESRYKTLLTNFFEKKGVEIVKDELNSDFVIYIKSDTNKSYSGINGVFITLLNSKFVLSSRNGIIYTDKIDDVRGLGYDYYKSSRNAYVNSEEEVLYYIANNMFMNIMK